MGITFKHLVQSMFALSLFVSSINPAGAADPVPRPFLDAGQYSLLQEMLRTHLNYFLSNDAVTGSGLPLGGYKEGDRGRFNYSNPTEWGYTLLAWIAAADEGIISKDSAAARIDNALNTISALQNNPSQNYEKLFYPYYYVANRDTGVDQAAPRHDANHDIPSIDNGFLYTSLLIAEGWATIEGRAGLAAKLGSVRRQMNFRLFLEGPGQYFAHLINADTRKLGSSHWDVYADEGGVMAWIAYLSDSINLSEFQSVIRAMKRPERSWNGITVQEAAWFNAMFTWGVRSLAGFPSATWETGITNRYSQSFANAVEGHLAYGDSLGVNYAAFSDVMTQGWVMRYTPPNISGATSAQQHAVPHALFIPLCIGPDLKESVLDRLLQMISELKSDTAGYYHNGNDAHKPFGFEAAASPLRNQTGYNGIGTEGRYNYETLSTAYIVLSIFQGLRINDGKKNFLHYAQAVPGYTQKVQDALTYLYPGVRRVPGDYPTIQAAIDAAAAGETIIVDPGTYNESLAVNKSGLTLQGTGRQTIIQGGAGMPAVHVQAAGGAETVIAGFAINGGSYSVRAGAASSVRLEDNQLNAMVYLDNGASATIQSNYFWKTGLVQTAGNNRLEFIRNTMGSDGANLDGLVLNGTEGSITGNRFQQRWNGAINLNAASNMTIGGNTFYGVYGWVASAGISLYNSGAVIHNNIISNAKVYQGTSVGVGIDAYNSSVWLYNNVLSSISGKDASAQGIAIRSLNSNLVAKNNIFQKIGLGQEAIYFSGTGSQEFAYNNMWEITTAARTSGIVAGAGNLEQDPLFASGFYLGPTSPCIDAGDPDPDFRDLNLTRNDMGAFGGGLGERLDTTLNMTEMNWYQNSAPYNSTGAAVGQMILNYIRAGSGAPLLSQNEIYEYGRSPQPFGTDLSAAELDRALGHFDPYDLSVTGGADSLDALPDGNPLQGYNYSVVTYDPALPGAMNNYMRDICHWLAYTVVEDAYVTNPVLVAKPNTPAAIPIYGSYDRWVAVKGYVTSKNPAPEPRTNPWYTPDFTVYGFWIKDPKVNGIGQDTYKTAAECADNYFLPLVSSDSYNGKYVQIAEPPDKKGRAKAEIEMPAEDLGNLDFIEVKPLPRRAKNIIGPRSKKPRIKKRRWHDLVDPRLLSDKDAVQAFSSGKLGRAVAVKRSDRIDADYYLVPFGKTAKGMFIASGVIVLDAYDGHFKEASWTKQSTPFLVIDRQAALQLLRRKVRGFSPVAVDLVWEPKGYSNSVYAPYWKMSTPGATYYVTQAGQVVKE